MSDGKIKVQVNLDDKQASKSIDNLQKKSKNLSASFKDAGKKLTMGLTVPITGLGVAMFKEAAELESTGAKFNEVFGDMANDVDDFIKEFQKLSPVTKAEGRVLISGIQDMLVPLGFAREEATEMSKEFMHLAGALANFGDKSVTVEQTMGAMQSALAGQMMPLRQLGIVTSAAEIEQKALQMTGKETTKELSRQEKMSAILEIAYENSTDALAAYKEENMDTDTELKIAMATFKDSLAILGTELLPVISKLIGHFGRFASWLGTLDKKTIKWMLGIGALLAVVGPLLIIVSKIITAFGILAPIFAKLIVVGKAIIGVIGGIAVGISLTAVLIAAAVAAIIVIVVLLWKNWDKVWGWITEKTGAFVDFIKDVGAKIKDVFKSMWEGVRNIFSNAWNKILDLFSKGGKIFSGITDGIASVFKKIVNLLIDGINFIIGRPFKRINWMLNKIRGFSIAGASPFKKLWGENPIPVPKIPKLATGTNYVAGEGLAYLHQGEAVVPRKYNPALGNNMGGTINIYQPAIELDGRNIAINQASYITKMIKYGGVN